MIHIEGMRAAAQLFDSHEHVCDLIEHEGPLLSLYTDSRDNWLYIWCDTDRLKMNRWALIRVTREDLLLFFDQSVTLRDLLIKAEATVILDETLSYIQVVDDGGLPLKPTASIRRRFTRIDDAQTIKAYWPTEESYFDPELAEGIDTQQNFAPSKYLIPVDGRWYFKDLDSFSRTYAKLYAFLYSTKPQFINSMNARLHDLLRAPWTGGYSRVNLFSSLRRGLPALHDLQIDGFNYASPGAIEVEALTEICEDVRTVVLAAQDQWARLKMHERIIDAAIGKHRLRKVDLSSVPDDQLPFDADEIETIESSCATICDLVGISDRKAALRGASPNLIVYAKAVQALLGQVEKLASFVDLGLLNFAKSQGDAEVDVKNAAERAHQRQDGPHPV